MWCNSPAFGFDTDDNDSLKNSYIYDSGGAILAQRYYSDPGDPDYYEPFFYVADRLGWSGRKEPTPQPAPGQVQLLEIAQQGEGWLVLRWKAPSTGGSPSAYKVMRRQRPEGEWSEVHTAVTAEANLINQPRGLELEYRIIAVNKAGQGQPSNTQMVVL